MSMFCRPSTGLIGNLLRLIDEYSGVNSLTSCPVECRYLLNAEETSARPPVLDSGVTSEAMKQTLSGMGDSCDRAAESTMRALRNDDPSHKMRRLLIGLTLVLLLAVSAAIGILVAYWPHLGGIL